MSTVVPTISNYKPFFICYESPSGGDAYPTETEWGLVAQSQPYPLEYKVREPYKNTWLNADGDEEYLDHLYLEPFEFEVKFYGKCTGADAVAELETNLRGFLNDISANGIATYDSWQQIGYKNVRLVSGEIEKRKIGSDYAWAILSVKFKANNPKDTSTLTESEGEYTIS